MSDKTLLHNTKKSKPELRFYTHHCALCTLHMEFKIVQYHHRSNSHLFGYSRYRPRELKYSFEGKKNISKYLQMECVYVSVSNVTHLIFTDEVLLVYQLQYSY